MARLGLEHDIVNDDIYRRTVAHLKRGDIRLPTFAELADPSLIPAAIQQALAGVEADAADPLNLFRVHWYNRRGGEGEPATAAAVPEHVVLPQALTGVAAPIIVVFGDQFPMIRAHKVLAAYGCLVPRLVTGQYDPGVHRAVWPSTGNYCRGGVAISRILGCRGVAVLPAGMSEERFRWLEAWVTEPGDIIRTVGTESNVKEIYDKCAELDADPQNIIFNQFCEFANYLVHASITGRALERVFHHVRRERTDLTLAAFTSATGSAGTIAAGDHLKEQLGARIVALEALECPTMLYNGFGEHNIQGIGDKHIPYIHNITNTDLVVAISDRSTDSLNLLCNTDTGREHLAGQPGISGELIAKLSHFGLSSLCNVLGAIKTAKWLDLDSSQAIITVATDGAAMYRTEIDKAVAKWFPRGFDGAAAARVLGEHLHGVGTDHLLELDKRDRDRIFNLGYFTWVEQQGVSVAEFEARRDQAYWRRLRPLLAAWDERIVAINNETGAGG